MNNFTNKLLLFLIFFTISFGGYSFAKDGHGLGDRVDVSKLKRSQLEEISEGLAPYFALIQQRVHSDDDSFLDSYAEDFQAIEVLSRYPSMETLLALWVRLKHEVLRLSIVNQDRELKDRLIAAIREMASVKDHMIFTDLSNSIDILKGAQFRTSGENFLNRTNLDSFEKLRMALAIHADRSPLPSINALLGGSESRRATENGLKEFSKILRQKIKGQPEVVEALENMEWENQFIAKKDRKPDVIYLMGNPGTGKDTAAEAFADALNGKDGAYKDHLYRLPLMRERPDLWQVLGSATGYVGSENFPPFLKFLVEHSGGKYLLESGRGGGMKVVENPNWHGENLSDFAPPENAVVFINEFHNWSKEIKDVFIKQALEKGIFEINNPNGGLSQIEVPVRFVIASNEGISLITARDSTGKRFGKPLSYEEMLEKWQRVQADKKALKTEVMNTNGPVRGVAMEGISEELLNRIPDRYLLLMRPLSPEVLREIVETEIQKWSADLQNKSPLNPGVDMSWDASLNVFIQEYDFNPEDNGRPLLNKVRSLIIEPLIQFFKSGQLLMDEPVHLDISVMENEDGTKSLRIKAINEENEELGVFDQFIGATVKDKKVDYISDDQIDRLANLSETIKQRVFGLDMIADRITERVISLANESSIRSETPRSASTLVLMGLSSTGKTELSKAIAEALTGHESNALVLDFSQIQSMHDFKMRILGSRDGYGTPIPSDFMKHYDRVNGDLVVVMDELSNVRDPDLLKSLYDFFREPVLSTFSDGKDRDMTRVKVIVTGNSGIELYKSVPRDVPMEQQMMAWEKISTNLQKNREVQRAILEKQFPEPLITRWGHNNIFFVPPHTYKSLKQLTQLKLSLMLKKLKAGEGRRGWDLGFENLEDYEVFIHSIIENAFQLREQGASIDSFVTDDLLAPIQAKLLQAKIPSGSRVLLKRVKDGKKNKFYLYSDAVEFETELTLDHIHDADSKRQGPSVSKRAQVLTAYHEVGHALTTKLLLDGMTEPNMISIVPGVAFILGQWVPYAGVAESEIIENEDPTREWVVRRIAIFAAGETAERLVTKGEVHSSGKVNDMERATRLAELAVLKFGLSEAWGTEGVPSGVDVQDYISRLSESKKRLFEKEVAKFINEGRALARDILEKNFDQVVVPLAKELARKGTLNKEEMAPFWTEAKVVGVSESSPSTWMFSAQDWLRSFKGKFIGRSDKRNGLLKSEDLMPESVAEIADIIEDHKQKQFSQVEPPADVPLFDSKDFKTKEVGCSELLR